MKEQWLRCLRFATPRQLRERGILGINRRNLDYLLPLNPRSKLPLVDDKLTTKHICLRHAIPTPETYTTIAGYGELSALAERVSAHQEFVIKPARGAGGRGITIVQSHDNRQFTTCGSERMDIGELRYHVAAILAGLHSLGGNPDCAIIERRVDCHPSFAGISVGGTPDIRVLLYRTEPVMAMVRLPTTASRGRANLHQGAVAAGIELASGKTTGGVWFDRAVQSHPDTGTDITRFQIAAWPELLRTARRLAEVLDLPYVGIDMVMDRENGPLVLEANARPGLAIQTANQLGLLPALDAIDNHTTGLRKLH